MPGGHVRAFVEVEVTVRMAIVGVVMPVNLPSPKGADQHVPAKKDQHNGNRHLQPLGQHGGDSDLESHDS